MLFMGVRLFFDSGREYCTTSFTIIFMYSVMVCFCIMLLIIDKKYSLKLYKVLINVNDKYDEGLSRL